jgi:WhiB family redox-sensing transcriptional regulator
VDAGWASKGACKDIADPSMFFPARGENDRVAAAKQVCAGCPVRAECLQWAIDTHEKYGVWGGLSERQRRDLRRGRVRFAKCRQCGDQFECGPRLRSFCSPSCHHQYKNLRRPVRLSA